MTTLTVPVRLATSYTPAVTSRAALNAECLARIISGQPIPAAFRPRAVAASYPSSAREGMERAMCGQSSAH